MGRRGKGEDSVYKRKDGRWVAQAMDPATGKRIYRYGKTRALAYAKLSEMQERLKKGQAVPNEKQTLRAYLDDWLHKVKDRHSLRESSVKRYTVALRRHVIPALGRESLARLSVKQLRDFYSQKQKELKPATVRTVHAVLRTALQDALIDELAYRNPADVARPASVKPPERPILTPEQANKLLAVAKETGDRWEVLYWVALNTAMRESELFALRWSDVDFSRRVLTIRASKTEAGLRSPGLIPQVVEKLHEQKRRLIEERLLAGPRWKDQGPIEQGLVFPNTIGMPQAPSDFLYQHFYRLRDRAGLPPIHFHDLRHSAISWLLSLGVPVVDVAKYVGHADVTTTLRIYAHALPDSQQAILAAMEQALLGGNRNDQAVK